MSGWVLVWLLWSKSDKAMISGETHYKSEKACIEAKKKLDESENKNLVWITDCLEGER